MRYSFPGLRRIGLLIVLALIATGCATQVQVTNTLPERLKDGIQKVDPGAGVDLQYVPVPDGEQVSINVGAMDYTLNRVFEGMLREMLTAKFDTLTSGAENHVKVTVNYLNLQQENYANSINRVDMAVVVELRHGLKTDTKEFEFSTQADVEGYSVQSGAIRNLLLQFSLAINDYIDQNWPRTQA